MTSELRGIPAIREVMGEGKPASVVSVQKAIQQLVEMIHKLEGRIGGVALRDNLVVDGTITADSLSLTQSVEVGDSLTFSERALEVGGGTSPNLSGSGEALIYLDRGDDKLKISENGGEFTNLTSDKAIVISLGSATGGDITTGVKMYMQIPIDLTVVGWTILGNASGAIVIDLWKDSYANFPPTVADTMTGSEKPTLSSAQKAQDLSLTTWDSSIGAGEIIGVNVDSVSGLKQVTLTLQCEAR